jgi:hypothetical protein
MTTIVSTLDELFNNNDSSDSKTTVEVSKFPTIPQDDWEPISIIQPNYKDGPWIAGGAPLRWWQGKLVGQSDIDIFCRDSIQAQEVIDRIKSYGRWSTKFESDNATTLSYWPVNKFSQQWTLQIIKRKHFKSLEEVIQGFDLTVCEIGTCGKEWVLGEFTARDIQNKVINFKAPLQPDAVKRLVKYWVYGYRPLPGTLEAIQDNPDSKWAYTIEEDYNHAF